MSSIKDTISSKKTDEGVSSEIENEHEIKEETEYEADNKDEFKIRTKEEPENKSENETAVNSDVYTDSEWKNRVLCSDGNCIGVIGPDGCCKECGKPYSETEQEYIHDDNEPEIYDASSPDEEDIISQNSEELNKISHTETEPELKLELESEEEPESESESESEWENRTLCSDGNCIGVIGPDGRCKECGKPI
jgi:hypothetical protein